MNEKRQSWIFRIKIFLIYLIMEPFKCTHRLFKMSKRQIFRFTKQKTWLVVLLGMLIGFFWVDNSQMKWAFLVIFVIAVLKYLWEKGDFMFKYKEKEKNRLRKKAEEEKI